jgi:hypothetical protein
VAENGKKALDAFIESTHVSGTVRLRHKAVKGARSWVWEYSTDPLPSGDKGWIQHSITTRALCVIEGLTPGAKYWFRASYVTKEGQSGWSDPVALIVV